MWWILIFSLAIALLVFLTLKYDTNSLDKYKIEIQRKKNEVKKVPLRIVRTTDNVYGIQFFNSFSDKWEACRITDDKVNMPGLRFYCNSPTTSCLIQYPFDNFNGVVKRFNGSAVCWHNEFPEYSYKATPAVLLDNERFKKSVPNYNELSDLELCREMIKLHLRSIDDESYFSGLSLVEEHVVEEVKNVDVDNTKTKTLVNFVQYADDEEEKEFLGRVEELLNK